MDKSQKYAGPAPTSGVASYDMKPLKKEKKMDAQGRIPGVKYMATDAQMRDYERNKPVNTPAGRARYADKAPKINPRKAYQD